MLLRWLYKSPQVTRLTTQPVDQGVFDRTRIDHSFEVTYVDFEKAQLSIGVVTGPVHSDGCRPKGFSSNWSIDPFSVFDFDLAFDRPSMIDGESFRPDTLPVARGSVILDHFLEWTAEVRLQVVVSGRGITGSEETQYRHNKWKGEFDWIRHGMSFQEDEIKGPAKNTLFAGQATICLSLVQAKRRINRGQTNSKFD